jgi:Tol biopolymer transport system component
LLNPSVSPDGRRIAYVKGVLEWDVVEVSLPSSAIRTLRGGGGTSWMPAWAPSGNHYLFVTNRSGAYAIEDMSADGGFARRLVEIRPGDFVKSPSWAPDGTRFIFDLLSSGGQTLMLANAASGTATAFDTDAKQSCCGVWAPDGEWVVYLRSTGGVWEMAKAKPGVSSSRTVFPSGATPESAIEWSPAGDWILCAARDGLTLVSRDGHSVRKLSSRNFDGGFAGPVAGFSKDGKQVFGVFHNTSGAGAEWQLFSVDVSTGAEKLLGALNVPAYAGSMVGFSLHPDGDRFATSISKWPYDIWMVEGIQEPKSWLGRLIQN